MQDLELCLQLRIVTRLDRELQMSVHPVAVDAVTHDELTHQRKPLNRYVPHHARPAGANEPLEFRLASRDTEKSLCTASP